MHEVAGSSPVESTKTPRFGIAVAGRFLLRFFGRARGWEPLCASKAFSPRDTLFTLSSGENKRLIIVWRGAPLQARALSNPPKHPVSALPLRGVLLLRFFGRARGWEPLCASKAFSPRDTLFTLSSGENKRLIIVWRGAPLQARALSNPPKHPVSALPFRGVFCCASR